MEGILFLQIKNYDINLSCTSIVYFYDCYSYKYWYSYNPKSGADSMMNEILNTQVTVYCAFLKMKEVFKAIILFPPISLT